MATGTAGSAARKNTSQQVNYLRFTVNFGDAAAAVAVPKQWLPAGAIVLRTTVNVITAFNAGTTNVLSVGTESATYANLGTSAAIVAGTPGLKTFMPPTGTAVVPLAADVQVFALYAPTGTTATTGQAIFVVEYIPNNDQ